MREYVLCFLLLSGAWKAEAGALHLPCSNPFVFPEAAVNVVVLPYTALSASASDSTGDRLSILVQMNALSLILKFGSVGAVQLVSDKSCDSRTVWPRLMSRGVRKGNGLVLVWGRIFEDHGQLFVQTFLRFGRSGVDEGVSVTVVNQRFDGRLSSQSLAFPAQAFSKEELGRVVDLADRFARVRTAPSDDAPSAPVLGGIARCAGNCPDIDQLGPLSYRIKGSQGSWVEIETGSSHGWLKIDTGFESDSFAAKMPELLMIEGLTGYLEAAISTGDRERNSAARDADEALNRYVEASRGVAPLTAAVVANEARAIMLWHATDGTSSDQAVTLLRDAQKLAPADAAARNLLTMAQLRQWAITSQPVSQREVADGFLSASILDPKRGQTALQNLAGFYDLALRGAGPGTTGKIPQSEILTNVTYLKSLLEAPSIVKPQ